MMCVNCNERESTGVLIHLCDPCFAAWEEGVNKRPDDPDLLRPVDPAVLYQSGGGNVPDDVVAAEIRVEGDVGIIQYIGTPKGQG